MAHDDHSAHHVNYLAVFAALCIFTGLSVLFDVLSFENRMITIVLVLAIAVAKAMSVMMFFMHLKFEGNWKFVLLAPTTILAIGLPIALLPDIGVKYYTTLAPQDGVWGAEMEELDAAHHGGGEHSKSEDAHAAPADDHKAPEADAHKA
ncbi:MAG: cytochrome C oxidase subunit IV family protein [Fuerstiella sp.]